MTQIGSSGRFCHARNSGISDFGDELGRDLDLVELTDMRLDIACRHAPRQQADDHVVETRDPAFAFGHDLGRILAVTIPGHINADGAGISPPKGALLHALRHTFATRAIEGCFDFVEVQRLPGHASLSTTSRYLDATAERLREAVHAHPDIAALRDLEPRP